MFVAEGEELSIIGCGSKWQALIFFPVFMIMVSFIFLNLFIAVILESFDTSKDEEGLQVGGDTISKFNEFWSHDKFDPKGTKFIPINGFHQFLMMIIDEEIRQRILYHEAMVKGEIDIEDQVDGLKIYMFNVHQDAIMIPIYLARRPNIYQQMITDGEIEGDAPPNKPMTPDHGQRHTIEVIQSGHT